MPDIIDEELNFLRPLTHAKSLSKLIVLQLAIFLRNPSHQFLVEMDFSINLTIGITIKFPVEKMERIS